MDLINQQYPELQYRYEELYKESFKPDKSYQFQVDNLIKTYRTKYGIAGKIKSPI
jgi:hypothetical protein